MVTCSAARCPNTTTKSKLGSGTTVGVSFHKFPKNEERLKQWVQAIGRENWYPTKHSTLCSAHFEENCIVQTPQNYCRLRDDAVPTKFPQLPPRRQQIHTNLMQSSIDIKIEDEAITPTILPAKKRQDPIHQPKEITSVTDTIRPKMKVIQGAVTPAPLLMAVLELQFGKLKALCMRQRRMIKVLHQRRRRNQKRIARIKTIMTNLVENRLIHEDHSYI